MGAAKQLLDTGFLSQLVPLDTLRPEHLPGLLRKLNVMRFEAGATLFEAGEAAKHTFYLLSGEVELTSPLSPASCVSAETDAARYPLAHHLPRQHTARAKTACKVLVLDLDVVELIRRIEQQGAQKSAQKSQDKGTWIRRWLESPLFERLPSKITGMLVERMREIPMQAGQVVIHQDAPAENYYVIKKGRCSVSRRPAPKARDVKLAELVEGQGFGEEAIIANATRNASVTMIEDGILMELSKNDFNELLADPLLRFATFDDAIALLEQGAVMIDVRTPEEFESAGLIGSLNMPMAVLRLKANRLDKDTVYIVCCDTGHDSAAAAFLMMQQGLNAHVLAGGLMAAPSYRIKRNKVVAGNQTNARQGNAKAENPSVVKLPVKKSAKGGQGKSESAAIEHALRRAKEEYARLLAAEGIEDEEGQARDANTAEDIESVVAEATPDTNLSWVNDEALWKTTLGYREDAKLEALLSDTPTATDEEEDDEEIALSQHFDDARLFTPIPELENAKLIIANDEPETRPQSRRSDSIPVKSKRVQHKALAVHAPRPHRTRLVAGVAVAIVLAAVGAAALYLGNGDMRPPVSENSQWMEKQKALDEKLNRLLSAVEKPTVSNTKPISSAPAIERAPVAAEPRESGTTQADVVSGNTGTVIRQ